MIIFKYLNVLIISQEKIIYCDNNMCNHCECDNQEKCSIIGYLPIGFCCEKCIQFNPNEKCSHYKVEIQNQSIEFFP